MNTETFRAFVQHASGGPDTPNDYVATKLAVMRMFPKLANPAHRSGLLQGVKNIAPAVGGVRTMGSNPLRAAASGVLHAKLASGPWGHAAEVAGLGILAAPSIQKLRGKQVSHKREAGYELAGLGTLAAPSAYHLLTRH